MRQKGFSPILILVIILIVAGVAFVVGQGLKTTPNLIAPEPSYTPDAMVEVNTSDWKKYEYSSEIKSFSISYPPDIVVLETEGELHLTKEGPTQYNNPDIVDGIRLVFIPVFVDEPSIDEYVNSDIKEIYTNAVLPDGLKNIMINGLSAISYNFGDQKFGIARYIYVESSDNHIVKIVEVVMDPQKQNYQKVIDQILSTFKFTN